MAFTPASQNFNLSAELSSLNAFTKSGSLNTLLSFCIAAQADIANLATDSTAGVDRYVPVWHPGSTLIQSDIYDNTSTHFVGIATSTQVSTETLGINGTLAFTNGNPGAYSILSAASVTGTRTITIPDATGTMTLLGNNATGSGSVVLATSPTLVTPTLGAATVTSINGVAITAPGAPGSATLTIANGKTLTSNSSITLAGVDGKTLTLNNNLTFVGTDGTTMTFPATSDTVATLATAQTWTAQKTFGVPGITAISSPAAINSTATASAAQMAAGVITSTSAAATTITTCTATALATQLGGIGRGATYDFIIDNSVGSNTVTLTLDASITVLAVVTGGNTLTVATTKIGVFRIYFISTTAAFIGRLA